MRIYFTLKMALNALRHNILRAALTTLGIIIGVAAVITMMEIGDGAKAAIQRTMASMGANTLMILPASLNIAGVNTGSGAKISLRPQDVEAMKKECPSVALRGANRSRPYPDSLWQPELGTDLYLWNISQFSRHSRLGHG